MAWPGGPCQGQDRLHQEGQIAQHLKEGGATLHQVGDLRCRGTLSESLALSENLGTGKLIETNPAAQRCREFWKPLWPKTPVGHWKRCWLVPLPPGWRMYGGYGGCMGAGWQLSWYQKNPKFSASSFSAETPLKTLKTRQNTLYWQSLTFLALPSWLAGLPGAGY